MLSNIKMPLFNKKPTKANQTNGVVLPQIHEQIVPMPIKSATQNPNSVPPPSLIFHCQLAHGSPTGLITGFSSVKELYQKIADCYDFEVNQVTFHLTIDKYTIFVHL